MNNPSFNFQEDFKYSHKNDFTDGDIDYLFSVGVYLFWCATTDGILTQVLPTEKSEIDTWYSNNEIEKYNVSKEEHKIHLEDTDILNNHYLAKIQQIIDIS